MFNVVLAIETKLNFVSLDDKHLQRRRQFVGERDTKLLCWSGSMSQQGPEILTNFDQLQFLLFLFSFSRSQTPHGQTKGVACGGGQRSKRIKAINV